MTITWLPPWAPVEQDDTRAALEAELRRELASAHPLFGVPATAIGLRRDQDDVLFTLPDGKVAEVHLTWRGGVEPNPRLPETTVHTSIKDWVEQSMKPTHADFLS